VKKVLGIFILLLSMLACGAPNATPQAEGVKTIVAATLDQMIQSIIVVSP
jgi:hypothetical protein